VLFLLAALAFFALYRMVYAAMDAGALSSGVNALQAYLSTGSRFLMGLFLIGYLSTRRSPFHERGFQALCMTLILSLVITAIYVFILQQEGSGRDQWATLFSYEVVAVSFAYLGLQLTRQINERKLWGVLACVGLLALGIVLWTETRIALFCFFIGGAWLLVLSERVRKWKVLGVASLLGAVVLIGSYPHLVKPRLMEARADITQYVSGENRATSIGARFELWRGSIMVLKQEPLGGGYWKRAEIIAEAVAQQRLDPVVLHYSQVNMHNELLEELSLRGVVGGALLLWVYFAVIALGWCAKPRNLALLGVVFAYAFSGLTDVLFFSREATVLFVTLLAVLIRSSPRRGET
jgi:O-antigen ligase